MLVNLGNLVIATFCYAGFTAAGPIIAGRQSAGCGTPHNVGYNDNNEAGFPLNGRTYTVTVPKGYDPEHPYPLILDFHGRKGNSSTQRSTSRYGFFDEAGEFLVVYPQGLPGLNDERAWQGAPYAAAGVDDLGFTADLVAHITKNYCVDSTRVYASGKSNGGGFVDLLACSSQGPLFAAFAMNSAALYHDNMDTNPANITCSRSRKLLPIIEVHGSEDSIVPYDGGPSHGGTLPPISQWIQTWGGTRDLAAGPTVHFPSPTYGSRVNVTTWHVSGTTEIIVEGIWIQGLDHCWASEVSNHDWHTFDEVRCKVPLNATTVFMAFFNHWTLNGYVD